jgi:hypothetical protein
MRKLIQSDFPQKMTIKDLILNINELSEEIVIYAKKIDGRFESSSEVVLPEEELM